MSRKADIEKEGKFLDYFCGGETAGKPSASAHKAGYSEKTSAQMGYYLRKKFEKEIRKRNEENIGSSSSTAISVLQKLLYSEQDSIRLNTAKLILELSNYHSQTINLNVDDTKSKTDDELIFELQELIKTMPNLQPKLQFAKDKNIAPDLSDGVPVIEEDDEQDKIVKH